MPSDKKFSDILDGVTTVGEAQNTLEPYQTVYLIGKPYTEDNFDSEAVHPRENAVYELQNHIERKDSKNQHSMNLGDTDFSLPGVMVESTRIPYKVVANTFNSLRYNHKGQLPDPLNSGMDGSQVTPERFRDYMEGNKNHELVKTDIPLLSLGFSSAFMVPDLAGVAGLLCAGYMTGENETIRSCGGLADSVEQNLDQIYSELTTELEDHRIEPI